MNRRRVLNGVCAAAALVMLGAPLLWQIRRLQLNSDLRAAIQQDRPETVKVLLARGADPDALGPSHPAAESWRELIARLFGRGPASGGMSSALGVAVGVSTTDDYDLSSAHWNPVVISTLLAHGGHLNPTDPQHPWGGLRGWTLDNNGFGLAYIQRFNLPPGSAATPVGTGHMYFEKSRGMAVISALRKAGLPAYQSSSLLE